MRASTCEVAPVFAASLPKYAALAFAAIGVNMMRTSRAVGIGSGCGEGRGAAAGAVMVAMFAISIGWISNSIASAAGETPGVGGTGSAG